MTNTVSINDRLGPGGLENVAINTTDVNGDVVLSGGAISGDNPAFQAEARKAFGGSCTVTSPVAASTGIDRAPFADITGDARVPGLFVDVGTLVPVVTPLEALRAQWFAEGGTTAIADSGWFEKGTNRFIHGSSTTGIADAAWVKSGITAVAAPDNALRQNFTVATGVGDIQQAVVGSDATLVSSMRTIQKIPAGVGVTVSLRSNSITRGAWTFITPSTVVTNDTPLAGSTFTVVALGDDTYQIDATGIAGGTGNLTWKFAYIAAAAFTGQWVGAGEQQTATFTGAVRSGATQVLTPTIPDAVWAPLSRLPYLTSCEVECSGRAEYGGWITGAGPRIQFRTALSVAIEMSQAAASGDGVLLRVGESDGVDPQMIDLHLRGLHTQFPTAIAAQSDFDFRDPATGAAVSHYVASVTGVAPNRIASVIVFPPAGATEVILKGSVGAVGLSTASASTLLANITGGTVSLVGGDRVHSFLTGANFITDQAITSRALVIAGGAGGGSAIAGGGGAGGFLADAALALVAGTHPVTVGTGGAGGTAGGNGTSGTNSVFATLTAIGGGFGASASSNGGTGGSGGGVRTGVSAGAGTSGQGFGGGFDNASVNGTSGGGGGASAAGGTASASVCGDGGAGLSSDIVTGSALFYAGGGGGGGYLQGPTTAGSGGNGGGGAGSSSAPGTAGGANTGGGGGGGGYSNVGPNNYAGGAGGSGIVVVRYPLTQAARAGRISAID